MRSDRDGSPEHGITGKRCPSGPPVNIIDPQSAGAGTPPRLRIRGGVFLWAERSYYL